MAVWTIDPPALATIRFRIIPLAPIRATALAGAFPFRVAGPSVFLKVQSPHTICRNEAASRDPVFSPVTHICAKEKSHA